LDTLPGINELFPPRETAASNRPRSVEDMGSQDFLALMVAQLENQDPTKPMDNMQFMGQLAQFGTVSGIQEMNESFESFAGSMTGSQALQAAGLVGRDVVIEGNVGALRPVGVNEDNELALALDATVEFPEGVSSANFYVQDSSGRLVYSAPLPLSGSGDMRLQWDGRGSDGEMLQPGAYRISAEGVVDGKAQTLVVNAHQQVESVAVDPVSGVSLSLANGQNVQVNEVKSFL
jgi:flagellar basal-body rod modification protein FlgD